ncbi:hypothetical protein HDV03_002222 [Kappamyces sp. JEL0829]|nr:hypothetical protein HDV03_002222 [Kappamyces sp. JEL0829]KAJ3355924.1 hypothetical protein HDU91_005613 [Kappamyces sp. JEL0680]
MSTENVHYIRASDMPAADAESSNVFNSDEQENVTILTQRLSVTNLEERKQKLERAEETLNKSHDAKKGLRSIRIKTMVFANQNDADIIPGDKKSRVDKAIKSATASTVKNTTGIRKDIRNVVLGNDKTETAPMNDDMKYKLSRANKVLSSSHLPTSPTSPTGTTSRRINIVSVFRGFGGSQDHLDKAMAASSKPKAAKSSGKSAKVTPSAPLKKRK